MNELFSNGCDCRTVLATPGLLWTQEAQVFFVIEMGGIQEEYTLLRLNFGFKCHLDGISISQCDIGSQ